MLKKLLFIILFIWCGLMFACFTQFRGDIPIEKLLEKFTDDRSRFMQLDGMNVHYMIEGTGIPLLLIHGTSSSLHTWEGWATELRQHFKVVRLDLPGFGLTGPNAEHNYTVEYYADFLNEFTNRLEMDTLYLAGNSLGGMIAWQMAIRHSEKVKKMILIDASGYPLNEVPLIFKIAKTPVLNEMLKYLTPEWVVKRNLNKVYFNKNKVTDELVEHYHKLTLREGNRDAFIARVKYGVSSDTTLISSIQCPVLVQWGKEDTWISLSVGESFHRDIPNSEFIVYENAGHIPMEEIPETTVADALTFFLKEL